MKKAIIMKGPSGVGKSSVSELICKNHNYKHCDADEFKWTFSHSRSKERTEIGEYLGYVYAKELIKRGHNVVIEAIPMEKLNGLLRKHKYKVIWINLGASLKQCIKNNATRKKKGYDKKVICEVYDKLSKQKGIIIDAEGKSVRQIYNEVRKVLR